MLRSRRARRFRRLFPIFVLAALALVPTAAEAKVTTVTLTDKATGLKVTAPKGFTLTPANGYYTVKNARSFGVFMTGTSPLTLKETGAALKKASGGTLVGKATSTTKLYKATLKVGKRLYVLTVRPRGKAGAIDVSLVGAGAPPKIGAKSGRLVQLSPTQLAQVAVLDSIIRSRRGGAQALVNVPIPMRLAQTADFLASANVPADPNWAVTGGNGLLAVEHPTLGFGWFGLTIAAVTPAFPFGRPGIDIIVNPSTDPGAILTQAFPQLLTQTYKMQFAFTQVQLVPGTEGILGATIPSAMYQVRFTYKNIPMQGLFLYGITNQTDQLVNTYFSGIAIADGAPGSYSNALLQTWASANGEAGFRERLSTTLENLANRPDREFILTPSRFRSDASTWISLLASGAR